MGKPQSVTVWLEFMYHYSIVEMFVEYEVILETWNSRQCKFLKGKTSFSNSWWGDTNSTWSFAKNINLNSVKAEYKKDTELKEAK